MHLQKYHSYKIYLFFLKKVVMGVRGRVMLFLSPRITFRKLEYEKCKPLESRTGCGGGAPFSRKFAV